MDFVSQKHAGSCLHTWAWDLRSTMGCTEDFHTLSCIGQSAGKGGCFCLWVICTLCGGRHTSHEYHRRLRVQLRPAWIGKVGGDAQKTRAEVCTRGSPPQAWLTLTSSCQGISAKLVPPELLQCVGTSRCHRAWTPCPSLLGLHRLAWGRGSANPVYAGHAKHATLPATDAGFCILQA